MSLYMDALRGDLESLRRDPSAGIVPWGYRMTQYK